MAEIQVKVPDIGDFKDVAIIEVLVKPGDTVSVEQSLITVESDKASMEIPSTHAGKVKSLAVKLGDTVNEGSVILVLEAEGVAALRQHLEAGIRRQMVRARDRRLAGRLGCRGERRADDRQGQGPHESMESHDLSSCWRISSAYTRAIIGPMASDW